MEEYLLKYASSGVSMLFTHIKYTDYHIEFIDPLCTIFKICLLHYKYIGTKFSIKNNTITIQDPSNFQGIQRWMNSDERDQLHHLKLPIFYFKGIICGHIKVYHLTVTQEYYQYINDLAIKGLKKIKIAYDTEKPGSLIKNCIDDYIKTLSTNYSSEDYFQQMKELNKPTLFAIYNEYTNLWKIEDFKIIMALFKKAEENEDIHLTNVIANAINQFIIFKDIELDKIRPN